MIDELEALVGHVFVVGGRAVSATPPGALVQLPPKRAQRGREQDTFFTLVTAAGSNQGQAAFYEQLARLAADLYFRSSGGVTSGLRDSISAVNSHLIEHNENVGQRFEANMICMVMRGREIYVGRAGSCLSLFRQGASFITFPDDLRDEYALNGLPLGYSPVPDIKLAHYDIAPGHVIVLADAGMANADSDKLRDALGAGNIQAILEPLKSLGGSRAQATVIEFVSTDTPDPAVLTPQPGSRITRSSSAPASSGVESPLVAESSPAKPVSPVRKTGSQPIRVSAVPKGASTAAAVGAALATGQMPPVQEMVAETKRNANRAGRQAVGGTASFLGRLIRGVNSVLDRLLPEPEEGGPHIPTMLAVGLAILVPVIIVFVVVAFQLSQVDYTAFEQTVHDVEVAANQAATIPLTDVANAKTAWLGVLQRIEKAETDSGRTGDPTLARIRAKAQGVLDYYGKVTRRTVTPLRSFGDNGKLVGPVIRGGTDMYTLDLNNSAIYRDTLNQNANGVVTRGVQPVVQRGQAVGQRSVRQLVDMVWMAEGGIQRANMLAALDTQGLLVTYSPTFAPATSQPLLGADRWVKPVAVATWQKRLYILDAGANQIWRYLPEGYSYPSQPEPYFTDYQPNLQLAIDFAIDSPGNLYVLFSDGTLKKFNGGIEQPFNFSELPDGKLLTANSLFLDSDSPLPAIYITDWRDGSIYEVTLSGRFSHRYRSSDPNAFKNLTGVFVDRDHVYVASGPLVYFFSVSDIVSTPTPAP
jgi:hypothetical protein